MPSICPIITLGHIGACGTIRLIPVSRLPQWSLDELFFRRGDSLVCRWNRALVNTFPHAPIATLVSVNLAMSHPTNDLIPILEQRVWRAVVERDRRALAELFADDYVEVTLDGRRVLKSEIVSQSPQIDDITAYSIDSPRIVELGEDAALINYHLTLDGACRGETITPRDRWATSVWSRINGAWRCRLFQQSGYAGHSEVAGAQP